MSKPLAQTQTPYSRLPGDGSSLLRIFSRDGLVAFDSCQSKK